jgi:hypothetical protein
MSDDGASVTSSHIDDMTLMHHLNCIFAPILRDDNQDPILPYDTIIPLTEADFSSDPSLSFNHVMELAALHDTLTPGFREGTPLNREQWLRSVAQLLALVLKGFSLSCPDTIDFDQLANLGLDEKTALMSPASRTAWSKQGNRPSVRSTSTSCLCRGYPASCLHHVL